MYVHPSKFMKIMKKWDNLLSFQGISLVTDIILLLPLELSFVRLCSVVAVLDGSVLTRGDSGSVLYWALTHGEP